jgi:hypothetical protein
VYLASPGRTLNVYGLAGTADSIVSAGASTAGALGGQIAGGTGLTAALGASVAIPVVGLAIAGVAIAIEAWLHRRGPIQKTQTTHIVDEVEPYLKQNLQTYLSGPRTLANQAQAEDNFYTLWNRVVAECGQPQYGDPGQNCINDRKRGSSKGYDWFALYLDPIANDSTVVADQAPSFVNLWTPAANGQPPTISPYLMAAAALFAGALILK